MLKRAVLGLLNKRLANYPAVALIGPRQAGKTTLAKSLGGAYFDLEQDADRLNLDLQWDGLVNGLARDKLLAVTAVDCGIVDIEHGRAVTSSVFPAWNEINVRDHLQSKLNVPVGLISTPPARLMAVDRMELQGKTLLSRKFSLGTRETR